MDDCRRPFSTFNFLDRLIGDENTPLNALLPAMSYKQGEAVGGAGAREAIRFRPGDPQAGFNPTRG